MKDVKRIGILYRESRMTQLSKMAQIGTYPQKVMGPRVCNETMKLTSSTGLAAKRKIRKESSGRFQQVPR